jgi:hypothetical protein
MNAILTKETKELKEKYTYDQKVELAMKIQNIKTKDDYINILNIITQDVSFKQESLTEQKDKIVENSRGIFMMFNKLQDSTYRLIEQQLLEQKKVRFLKKRKLDMLSSSECVYSHDTATLEQEHKEKIQENIQEEKENKKNIQEEKSNTCSNSNQEQKPIILIPALTKAKYRFSNREKNIIKRRKYDETINVDNVSKDIVYKQFALDTLDTLDTLENSETLSKSEQTASENKIKTKVKAKIPVLTKN